MMEEDLNIENNIRKMVLSRLNNPNHKKLESVAESLGISLRTLHNYMDRFRIVYDREIKKYKENSNNLVIIS
jgi:hypothetical protein